MRDRSHLQNTNLVECPPRNLLCKRLIRRLYLLSARTLYLRGEPRILEHLGRAHDSESRRIPRLHRAHERKLRTNRERVFDTLRLLLGVV